jgi:hypothetical protein
MTKKYDGKKGMKMKGPNKKRIGGIEEKNVLVPIGGI